MAALTINGLDVPIERESLKRDPREVGVRGECFDGTPFSAIRSIRRNNFSFRTTPLTVPEAEAWRAMIQGDWATWSFQSGTGSDQGHGTVVTYGAGFFTAPAVDPTYKIDGTSSLLLYRNVGSSGTVGWKVALGAPRWTADFWMKEGTYNWKHVVVTSDSRPGDGCYVNGNYNDDGYIPQFVNVDYSTGYFTLGDGAMALERQVWVDSIRFVRACVPETWIPSIYAAEVDRRNAQTYGTVYRRSPFLRVRGDVVHKSNDSGFYANMEIECIGTVKSGPNVEEFHSPGLTPYERLEVELTEKSVLY